MASVGIRDYKTPGVYLNDVGSVNKAQGNSPVIAAFLGIAAYGPVGEAVLVNSWQEYISKFARGLATPYMQNSYLAHSVYGFFQNGGKKCYVIRVVGTAAAKATATLDGDDTSVVKAKYEGEWANDMTLLVTANGTDIDLTVKIGAAVVEKWVGLSVTSADDDYWCRVINDGSNFLTVTTMGTLTPGDAIPFAGGASDLATITDATYVGTLAGASGAINALDDLNDFRLIAIPGQTSATLQLALLTYCQNKGKVFAILDPAETATADQVITARNALDFACGDICYPWGKVFNPLSTVTNALRNCPPSGHVAGVYARFIEKYGAWRAPAGTEAVVEGFIDLVAHVSDADLGTLNAANVNCIVSRANYGLILWGARNLSKDKKQHYVSDTLLNHAIKHGAYEAALPFVFEGNNPLTRARLVAAVETVLDPMWRAGAFKGAKKSEAYFVRCDETNNTDATMEEGKLICEIGYAATKPSEFIIFEISYNLNS